MSSSDLTQKKDRCECSVKTKPERNNNEIREAGGYWEGPGEKENYGTTSAGGQGCTVLTRDSETKF